MTLSVDEQRAVTDAVRMLDIVPRKLRWAHLSLCVLDAVFSINARYGGAPPESFVATHSTPGSIRSLISR